MTLATYQPVNARPTGRKDVKPQVVGEPLPVVRPGSYHEHGGPAWITLAACCRGLALRSGCTISHPMSVRSNHSGRVGPTRWVRNPRWLTEKKLFCCPAQDRLLQTS